MSSTDDQQMQYTVVFKFTADPTTRGMTSSINLTDDASQFVMSTEKNILFQAIGASPTPPMTSVGVYSNRFSFLCAENTTKASQSLQVVLPVVTSATSLKGEWPSPGMNVTCSYQVFGSSSRGTLTDPGPFEIPFQS